MRINTSFFKACPNAAGVFFFFLEEPIQVLMRIGMTAAENDETGDHGLARTVDKTSWKADFEPLSNMGFCTALGGQLGSDHWGDPGRARTYDRNRQKATFV